MSVLQNIVYLATLAASAVATNVYFPGGQIQDVKDDLKDIEGDLGGVIEEIEGDLRGLIKEIQGDLGGLIKEIRDDIKEVRDDVEEVRDDIEEVKRDINGLITHKTTLGASSHVYCGEVTQELLQ